MICQRCTRLLSPSILRSTTLRPLSTTSRLLRPESPAPATSTSAAQPFSTPFTPSPSKTPGIPSSPSTTPKVSSKGPEHPPSSCKAGTSLRGLSYTKGQDWPIAREDSEYPEWLWGLLGPKRGDVTVEGLAGDAFAKSKKQRRLASKAARAMGGSSHTVHVPLEEQSIDLPAGMDEVQGQKALEARKELKSAMRVARRKKIKENNFLRGMR